MSSACALNLDWSKILSFGKELKVTRLYCKHLKVNLKFIFEDYLPEGPIEAFDDWEEDYDQLDDFLENDDPLAAERWDMS